MATHARPRASRSGSGEPARVVVVMTLLALVIAGLLNADELVRRARALPYGWERSAAVTVAEALHGVSHAARLDRPREVLDRALGHDSAAAGTPGTVTPVAPQPLAPSGTTPSGGDPPVRPAPTKADPLRVFLGGDSVSQAVAQAFARLAGATGVVQSTVEFRFSTGLTRPDYFDWPGRLRTVLAASPPPDVVVVMFGANDVQRMRTPEGTVSAGTAAWLAEYRRRVAETMDQLQASGVTAYWLGQPAMRSATFDLRIAELDDIYAQEAAGRPAVTYVDTRALLGGGSTGYTAYLRQPDGSSVQVRTTDGVHLTRAGGELLARTLLMALRQRWPLPE